MTGAMLRRTRTIVFGGLALLFVAATRHGGGGLAPTLGGREFLSCFSSPVHVAGGSGVPQPPTVNKWFNRLPPTPFAPALDAAALPERAAAANVAPHNSVFTAKVGYGASRLPGLSWRGRGARKAEADATVVAEEAPAGKLQAFWKFLRPHTIRGTILGSSAMVARSLLEWGKPPDWSLLPRAACGVVALLCGNGYIVGINQIYDVSIDVINKPFLPIAAKELSISQAWFLIVAMAIAGTYLSFSLFGPLIGGLYAFGLFLGTIYSVPPLRLKQSAVAAALIIATVRGLLLNFGVYYACRAALGIPFSWSAPTAFMTCFATTFAIVIAVTKDLPDVQGDLENNIDTFATRFGVDKVALASTCVVIANYVAAVFWALGPSRAAFRPQVLLPVHAILTALMIRGTLRLRKAGHTQEALKAYYRLIWLCFYTEYLMFPFI